MFYENFILILLGWCFYIHCQKIRICEKNIHVLSFLPLFVELHVHFFIDPPSDSVIDNVPSILYEADPFSFTCSSAGGRPPANVSWSCDSSITSNRPPSGSNTGLSTWTGTVNRDMDMKTCRCTSRHYAWLEQNQRTKEVTFKVNCMYIHYVFIYYGDIFLSIRYFNI